MNIIAIIPITMNIHITIAIIRTNVDAMEQQIA
jgi:hypothetical protein